MQNFFPFHPMHAYIWDVNLRPKRFGKFPFSTSMATLIICVEELEKKLRKGHFFAPNFPDPMHFVHE
jgi:hypothetical protein